MKRLAATVALALLLPVAGLAEQAPPQKPVIQEGQVVAPLYRTDLYVRDMDKALKLYRDILKLKVVSDGPWDPRARGLKTDIQVRQVILSAGHPTVGNLALYEIKGQKEPVRPPFTENFGHTADAATVWNTKDIWNINDEVQAAGYVVLSPPVTLLARPEMLVQGVEMQFRDADGFLVNIIQSGIRKDSPEAKTAKIPDRQPEVMGTPENTWVEQRMKRFESKAKAEPVHPGQRLAPMSRSTTFVRDRDASLKFYRDILGMTQLMSNYWRGVGINRIKNVKGLEQWAVILMAGDSANGNIGVYQLYGEKLDIPRPNIAPVPQIGDRGTTFFTKDIHGLHKKYRDAGFPIMTPPVRVGNHLEMMLRDPDGNIVTFFQEAG
jgi:catechol 2,3-dioxygenase-like lactoylglutathione lyase family enzyme